MSIAYTQPVLSPEFKAAYLASLVGAPNSLGRHLAKTPVVSCAVDYHTQ